MATKKVCMTCESIVTPKYITKGSLLLEIILWCLWLFPGLIYSIWRLTSRYEGCPVCGGNTLVPLDSPLGRRVQAEKSATAA